MKKINLNSIAYWLLNIIVGIVVLVVVIDAFIIINDMLGNDALVKKIDEKVDKIFTYDSK